MSCNEIGSHSRSRAVVITRSTARRCAATVPSFNDSASCILFQRFSQLRRNRDGNDLLALALHTGHLLLTACNQLFAGPRMTPVLEIHRDAVLRQFTEPHTKDDLIERHELRHK